MREHKADYVGPRWVVKAASLDMHPMDSLNRSKYLKDQAGSATATSRSAARRSVPSTSSSRTTRSSPRRRGSSTGSYDPILWVYRKLRGK